MRASYWMIGLLALLVYSGNAHAFDCLPSATAVRQQHPKAWPSWTLRAPGHEGTRCWYDATRSTAHDHQNEAVLEHPKAEMRGAVAPPQEIRESGRRFPPEAMDAVSAPRPDPMASFADRFSAAYGHNFNTDSRPALDGINGIYRQQ
jgi:hypothetical protein